MSDTLRGEIVHNPDSRDHFEVLGLPRRLVVDQDQLSRHYYRLSRTYHPDFHQKGTPAERIASLRRTAAVNDAHKTLRDPVARGRWWLESHGRKLGDSPQVPPELAMLVLEVQEVLENLRQSQDSALAEQVHARNDEIKDELNRRMEMLEDHFARWDTLPEGASPEPLLDELAALLAEISYLKTLRRDVDRTLESVGA